MIRWPVRQAAMTTVGWSTRGRSVCLRRNARSDLCDARSVLEEGRLLKSWRHSNQIAALLGAPDTVEMTVLDPYTRNAINFALCVVTSHLR